MNKNRPALRRIMRTNTESVILQNFDDTALSDMARIVRVRHPRQFFPKLREYGHASVNRGELFPRDLVGGCAVF